VEEREGDGDVDGKDRRRKGKKGVGGECEHGEGIMGVRVSMGKLVKG